MAIEFDIPHGGWIPKGRKTEDGVLPARYQLQEMPTASYPKRTEKNVLDSDGTLIVSHGKLTGGSALTLKMAKVPISSEKVQIVSSGDDYQADSILK